jgi:signal transduction histidine kinase
MRLASKLTLALVAVMCAVLSLYGYLSVRRERALFETDMRRDEHLLGIALRAAVAEVWARDGQAEALRVLEGADAQEDGISIRWVWLDAPPGDPFAPQARPELLEGVTHGSEIARVEHEGDKGGRFFTYAPVAVGAPRVGAIEISESLEEEERYVKDSVLHTVTTLLALASLSALLAAALGQVLVARPTRRLVEKTRRIGEGDLTTPLVLDQRDELGVIAREIEAMCRNLAEAQERAAREASARIATLEQLRHADRLNTVGKLASGIAHELGTPLNVVSGRAKMISRGAPPEEAVDNARIIAEQVDRMTKIIRQLLDFARRRGAQKAPADLAPIARQTLSLLEPLGKKRGVKLRFAERPADAGSRPSSEASEGARAEVDAAQIQQVLTNLIMNGIQATRGGGELTVAIERVRATPPADHGGPEGEYLAIRVSDQGDGIPPEDLARIFEPFFTTKDVGEGTGLGLSVTYGIVQEHGGWIHVESEVKKGSTFTVYLAPGGEGASPHAGPSEAPERTARRGAAAA